MSPKKLALRRIKPAFEPAFWGHLLAIEYEECLEAWLAFLHSQTKEDARLREGELQAYCLGAVGVVDWGTAGGCALAFSTSRSTATGIAFNEVGGF